jgi:hypothetical protein
MPSAAEYLFRQYRRLRFAESDWLDARAAAEMLLTASRGEGEPPFARRALHTAMCVSYGRPFSNNKGGVGSLDKVKWAPQDPTLRSHHEELLELRRTAWAHTDADAGHRAVRFYEEHGTWMMEWSEFNSADLARIVTLLNAQTARAKAAALAAQIRMESAADRTRC